MNNKPLLPLRLRDMHPSPILNQARREYWARKAAEEARLERLYGKD